MTKINWIMPDVNEDLPGRRKASIYRRDVRLKYNKSDRTQSLADEPKNLPAASKNMLHPPHKHGTILFPKNIFILLMSQPSAIDQFHRQGFLVLPRFATPQFCEQVIALAQQHLAQHTGLMEYEADTGYPGAPESRNAEGGQTVRRLLQAYARAPMLAAWASAPALVQVLQQLLGADVLLTQAHHNCIMTKQPHYSTATSWHRDSRYWHFQRAELVSSWLALRDEAPENGCLLVIPGSHQMQISPEQFDERQFLRSDLAQNRSLLAQAQPVPLQQGDLLLFHSNLFHAAGRNQTDNTKFSLVFAWRAQNNPPEAGTRSASLPEIALVA